MSDTCYPTVPFNSPSQGTMVCLVLALLFSQPDNENTEKDNAGQEEGQTKNILGW